jgi:predicted acylesterase/phospholipase RssA
VPTQARETVFDFRPRLVLPGLRPAPESDAQSKGRTPTSRLHLHVYQQDTRDPTRDSECNGDERRPIGSPPAGTADAGPPQVGVVLSGGISKGLAFVGALQVLDDVGIRVDAIAGTSMGAVIGAFYAAGYAPTDLYSGADGSRRDLGFRGDILGGIDWYTMFTDVPDPRALTFNQHTAWGMGGGTLPLPRVYQGGLRSGQNLSVFLGKYLLAASGASNGCFDNLYVPFRAKATDITSGRSRTLRNGELATAVRASLSFPVLFTPTPWRGARLMDGGLLNNYPVDAILEPGDGDSTSFGKPRPVLAAPTPARPASSPFRVLIGIDVSDTKAPELPAPHTLQLLSSFGAFGSLSDGIGASISRETKRQRSQGQDCAELIKAGKPMPAAGDPCLFHIKIERDGGFADFAPDQIADFVQSGRERTIRALCDSLVNEPEGARGACNDHTRAAALRGASWHEPASEDRQRVEALAIERIKTVIRSQAHPWRTLLHDPTSTMREAASVLRGTQGAPRPEDLRKLSQALAAFRQETEARPEEVPWNQPVEGLEARLRPDGVVEVHTSTLLKADTALRRSLLDVAQRTLCWMSQRLDAAECPPGVVAELPDGRHVSGVRVSAGRDWMQVRVTNWVHRVRGVIATRNLVQVDRLDDVRVASWQVLASGLGEHRDGLLDKTLEMEPKGQRQLDCVAGAKGQNSTSCPWKEQIATTLIGRELDLRYFAGNMPGCATAGSDQPCHAHRSMAQEFERLQERYYANTESEFFRIQGVRPGYIELAEKDTHRAANGAVHLGYHYDYRNKHSLSVRLVHETQQDAWYKPARTIAAAMINEPVSNADGVGFVDATLLYMPRITNPRPGEDLGRTGTDRDKLIMDLGITGHLARRGQMIAKTDQSYLYDDAGWTVIGGLRPGDAGLRSADEKKDARQNRELDSWWAPYASYAYRRIGDVRAQNLSGLRRQLHDAGLGQNWRRFESVALGARGTVQGRQTTGIGQGELAAHQGNGAWHAEFHYQGHVDWKTGLTADADIIGLRVAFGRIWTRAAARDGGDRPAVPVDQIYSLGGYYPLADQRLWGRKRVDYLGADLNQRWGNEMTMVEGRYSLWRVPAVGYFAPYSKLQLDAVLQAARIGFATDANRPWRYAKGLLASAYLPAISAFKVRGTAAIGGESRKSTRFYSSLEVLF